MAIEIVDVHGFSHETWWIFPVRYVSHNQAGYLWRWIPDDLPEAQQSDRLRNRGRQLLGEILGGSGSGDVATDLLAPWPEPKILAFSGDTLWSTYKKRWNITIFNGYINYKWAMFNSELLDYRMVSW